MKQLSIGQLDSSSPQFEQNLVKILKMASHWNAVLLPDEAEIFIEQRGNSSSTDRLVCVFLRVLEYFDGLMFLTINLVKKIDHAIWSRIDYVKMFKGYLPPASAQYVST